MFEEISRYEALKLCRDRAGSDSQMARDLLVTQPRVWRWLNQSKQLPAEYVLRAEELYGISRHQLRPDIYPPSHRFLAVDQCAEGVSFQNLKISHRGSDGVGEAA